MPYFLADVYPPQKSQAAREMGGAAMSDRSTKRRSDGGTVQQHAIRELLPILFFSFFQ